MTTPSTMDLLDQGIRSAKAGNSLLARMHFQQAVAMEPENETIWIWLAWVADSPASAVESFDWILSRHPHHHLAKVGREWAAALAEFDLEQERKRDTHIVIDEHSEEEERRESGNETQLNAGMPTFQGTLPVATDEDEHREDTAADSPKEETVLESSPEQETVEEPTDVVGDGENLQASAEVIASEISEDESPGEGSEPEELSAPAPVKETSTEPSLEEQELSVETLLEKLPPKPLAKPSQSKPKPPSYTHFSPPKLSQISEPTTWFDRTLQDEESPNETDPANPETKAEECQFTSEGKHIEPPVVKSESSEKPVSETPPVQPTEETSERVVSEPVLDEEVAPVDDMREQLEKEFVGPDWQPLSLSPSARDSSSTKLTDSRATGNSRISSTAEVNETRPAVLVVDDSPTVRKLVSMTLDENRFRVVSAVDGVDAINEIARHKPDLILMDIAMPRLDGYKLCKLVKKHESTQHIPVLMLSGKDGTFDKLRGRLSGCTDYITKPFDPQELVQMVEKYLTVSSN